MKAPLDYLLKNISAFTLSSFNKSQLSFLYICYSGFQGEVGPPGKAGFQGSLGPLGSVGPRGMTVQGKVVRHIQICV